MITPSTSTTGVIMAQAYQCVARARFNPGRFLLSVLRLRPRAAGPVSGPVSPPAAFATDWLV